MLKLFSRQKAKGRTKQVRAVMASLWARLAELERSGKIPDRVLFVVEDPSLARALEKKLGPRAGVVLMREQGPATEAAKAFAEAALNGFRVVLVLRTKNWVGWAILVRSLLRNHVAIISAEPFEVKTSTEPWRGAPAPFTDWWFLPPNGLEERYPVRADAETERSLLEVLDDWDGDTTSFLPVPF